MKLAVIGSRNLSVDNLEKYLPQGVTEIISGGARGIDTCAKHYAEAHKLKLMEFLPEYEKYGRGAPLRRNLQIIDYADEVLAFWDGQSRGTRYVIEQCRKKVKSCTFTNRKRCTKIDLPRGRPKKYSCAMKTASYRNISGT